MADLAHIGEEQIITPKKNATEADQITWNKEIKRHRQVVERLHLRLKEFQCLRIAWRHDIALHPKAYFLICNIVNLDLIFRPLNKS